MSSLAAGLGLSSTLPEHEVIDADDMIEVDHVDMEVGCESDRGGGMWKGGCAAPVTRHPCQ